MSCSIKMLIVPILSMIFILPHKLFAEVGETDLNDISEQQNAVQVNKCCEKDELLVNSACRLAEFYNETIWKPKFKTEDGNDAAVKYRFLHGAPDCTTPQRRTVLHLNNTKTTEEKFNLLTDGHLLYIIYQNSSTESVKDDSLVRLQGNLVILKKQQLASYTYKQYKYCMDKILMTANNTTYVGEYAVICISDMDKNWTDIDIVKEIVNLLKFLFNY